MKLHAVVTQVTARKYAGKDGTERTYFDAFLMDAEPNPLDRFPGQIAFKPTADEVKEFSIVEGAQLEAKIMQVLELRNGVPVCQLRIKRIESPLPTKPAKA